MELGYPIKIVDFRDLGYYSESLDKIDALLIPGGVDINPDYYLPQVSQELQDYTQANRNLVNFTQVGEARDALEYVVVKKYSADDKYARLPLLGICRGMQMMSVAQGIPLYLDIKTELGIKNRRKLFDTINISDDPSLMKSLYGTKVPRGFKNHHQGIRVPYYKENASSYPLTRVTASSNGGKIAESIEYTHRPALGVQYHPEMSFPSTTRPLFNWFLTSACNYKNTKGPQ